MVWRVKTEGVLEGEVAIVTGTSRGVGVGIAHELLGAGATVIGCSRSKLEAIPGTDHDEAWLQRSAQMVCDQGDFGAIDAMVAEVVDTYGRIDILVNNAGGTVPSPNVEDVPELVAKLQGAPRADDDFERTALFHAFAIQMNLISRCGSPSASTGRCAARTVSGRSSTSPAAPVIRRGLPRWCPTARRRRGSTTSPARWPRSGGRVRASTRWRSARR